MSEIFADTSGWGCLVDPTQTFHNLTTNTYRIARRQGRTVVTTNYVIVELVALLTSPLRIPRPSVISFVDSLNNSPFVEVVHVDPVLNGEAWKLLRSRQDKEWSLVDCASFVLMQQRAIIEAMTTDHHFEQAGFVRLLK